MKFLQISTFLFVVLVCNALAADTISVRGMEVARNQELPDRYVKVGDKYMQLSFSSHQPSDSIWALTKEFRLQLYELVESEEAESSYKIAEEVKLPEGAKGVILLGWKSGEEHQFFAIDDNFTSKKYDDWLLVNTSSKEVNLQLGKENEPIIIDADSSESYKMSVSEKKGIAAVAKAEHNDKLKTFYSTFWAVQPGERGIVIFFYDKGKRMALRKINGMLLKPRNK